MTLATSRRAHLAFALHFFSVAGIILCRSYTDMLFLSTYPRQWLPYLFMGQTGVTFVMALGLTPLISKGSRWANLILLIVAASSVIAARFAVPTELPGVPFGLCLWLSAMTVLLGVISWNVVSDAFDIREFKQVAKWVGAAGSVGALVIGLAIPTVVSGLGADALLVVLGGVVVAAGVFAYLLSPKGARSSAQGSARRRASPTRYPLFRWLALGVVLLVLVDVLADFTLKNQLALTYDRDGIAAFMGPFYGIASAVMLPVQFLATDWLLKRWGVFGLLVVVPGLCLFGAAGVAISPGLWTAATLRFVENVGYYALYNVGREIAGTPLPSAVRRAAKLFLKGIVTPGSIGVAALLLWLAAEPLGDRGVALVAIGLCALWIYAVRRIAAGYRETLEEAVRSRRLGFDADGVDDGARHVGREVILRALASDDPDVVIFGLGVVERLGDGRLPAAALSRLDDRSPAVRSAIADSAMRLGAREAVPRLLDRLEREADADVVWHLLEALAALDAVAAAPLALRRASSDDPAERGAALLVLLRAGDLDGLILAAQTLKRMIDDPSSRERAAAAKVIAGMRAGYLERELRRLIADEDDDVATTAIRAAGERKIAALAPDLGRRLGPGSTGRSAALALIQLGEAALDTLQSVAKEGRFAERRAAIRALVHITTPRAEALLLELLADAGVDLSTVAAREVARRARRDGVSPSLREAARALALAELPKIAALAAAEACEEAPPALRIELRARRILSQTQFLHWLAACTRPGPVLDVIPAILDRPGDATPRPQRAAAIELLDATIGDRELRRALADAVEPKATLPWMRAIGALQELGDAWILGLIDNPTISTQTIDETMDTSLRALLLRKVDLFEALPGDVLLSIAEMTETREIVAGEKIFSAGDPPEALYIVASGGVDIIKEGEVIASLARPGFFGELGLLDDAPRLADAVATADGVLVAMDKESFLRVTEDLPEVLRAVIKKLTEYVRAQNDPTSRLTRSG